MNIFKHSVSLLPLLVVFLDTTNPACLNHVVALLALRLFDGGGAVSSIKMQNHAALLPSPLMVWRTVF